MLILPGNTYHVTKADSFICKFKVSFKYFLDFCSRYIGLLRARAASNSRLRRSAGQTRSGGLHGQGQGRAEPAL
jgi:hypothetical protein